MHEQVAISQANVVDVANMVGAVEPNALFHIRSALSKS